jgi:hypothetical protein
MQPPLLAPLCQRESRTVQPPLAPSLNELWTVQPAGCTVHNSFKNMRSAAGAEESSKERSQKSYQTSLKQLGKEAFPRHSSAAHVIIITQFLHCLYLGIILIYRKEASKGLQAVFLLKPTCFYPIIFTRRIIHGNG